MKTSIRLSLSARYVPAVVLETQDIPVSGFSTSRVWTRFGRESKKLEELGSVFRMLTRSEPVSSRMLGRSNCLPTTSRLCEQLSLSNQLLAVHQ